MLYTAVTITAFTLQSPDWSEQQWSAHIAAELGGKAEVTLADDSRCDVLTETHAWEVEWGQNWKSGPGQAILYGVLTERKPGVILLLKRGEDNKRFVLR